MAEYAPIQYVKNIQNYFPAAVNSQAAFDAIANVDGLRDAVWLYSISHLRGVKGSENDRLFKKVLHSANNLLCNALNVNAIQGLSDMHLYMYIMNIHTASAWRKNKLSYKVDGELIKQFYEMELPRTIIKDYAVNQPADAYYIDASDYGDKIMKGLHGIFVSTHRTNDMLLMRLTLLAPGREDGDVYILHAGIPTDEADILIDDNSFSDSISEEVNPKYLYRFLLNFLIYLHAANKDVEISERTRPNHTKPKSDVIKDKFRELKEFEVGVRYGSEIRKNKVRYKYVGNKEENANHEKRKLSSHYRAAHWHRYWVGSGDDKSLITKWVEGVFVKGNVESDSVTIHKVK